jgi:hypothetical protein
MDNDQLRRAVRGKTAEDDRLMEATLRGPLDNNATHMEWRAQMRAIKGWSRETFKRRLKGFKQRHPELVGARWWGDPYTLPVQPSAAMAELVASLRTWLIPSHSHVKISNRTQPGSKAGPVGLVLPDEDLIARARTHIKDGVG